MTTALIVPFGADDTEIGRARQAIWNRCYRLWVTSAGGRVLLEGQPEASDRGHLIVAGDPLFGAYHTYGAPDGIHADTEAGRHPFSVARAVNRAVRLAPPDVDKFVCIGADALPDWRVVDWASAELDTRPWTLLYGKGASVGPAQTAEFAEGYGVGRMWLHENGPDQYDVQPFETPCVGPIAFTREAFLAVRGFDERFEGWFAEDVDLWNRLRELVGADFWGDDGKGYGQTSPYPLVQFSHPATHHDSTDANPNVRLYRAKWIDHTDTFPMNGHPAEQLMGAVR